MTDINDIKHLAHLARIEITDAEAEGFQKDFGNIFGYIESISSVELESVDERGEITNVMREDDNAYEPETFSKDILDNAPDTKDGFIKVQKIL